MKDEANRGPEKAIADAAQVAVAATKRTRTVYRVSHVAGVAAVAAAREIAVYVYEVRWRDPLMVKVFWWRPASDGQRVF